MSVIHYSGEVRIEYFRKRASQAFTANTLVERHSDGTITPCTSSTAANIKGVILKTIASTDSDYASTTLVPVLVPLNPETLFEVDVTTGTLAASSEGLKFDLTDAAGVNQSATTNKVMLCEKYISASKGLFKICGLAGLNQ